MMRGAQTFRYHCIYTVWGPCVCVYTVWGTVCVYIHRVGNVCVCVCTYRGRTRPCLGLEGALGAEDLLVVGLDRVCNLLFLGCVLCSVCILHVILYILPQTKFSIYYVVCTIQYAQF